MGKAHRNVRGHGAKRRDKDLYETDPRLCRAIVRRLDRLLPSPVEKDTSDFDFGDGVREVPRKRRIIEPSAGSGNFVRAMRAQWQDSIILAVDLHQQNAMPLHRAGATSYAIGRWQTQDVRGFSADLIGGNPPFSEAEEHVAHALDVMPDGAYLFYLLPVTFLATQGRCTRLWTPSDAMGLIGCGGLRYYWTLAERPSFTNDGATDMTEYGVYVWKKGFTMNPEILPPMWWRTEAP